MRESKLRLLCGLFPLSSILFPLPSELFYVEVVVFHVGVVVVVEVEAKDTAWGAGALESAYVDREVGVAPVEDAVGRRGEEVVYEVGVDGVVILGVAVDHHVEQSVLAGVLDLGVEVEVLARAPHTLETDGPHGVGVEGIGVDADGVVDDARVAHSVDIAVGAIGGAVVDGIGEEHAFVGLDLFGGSNAGEEHDCWVVVASVEAEDGVVVVVDASVGDDVDELRLEGGIEFAVVAAVASRERQERCYCKDDSSHCF